MIEQQPIIVTADGQMTTYICHPERHGPHPIVILYMDAYGYREELRAIACRLATSGYYVMLPNLYYRMGVNELGPIPEPGDERRIGRLTACVQSLTIPTVMDDTRALLNHADSDPNAANSVGCVGYCMSGRFAVAAAAYMPDRIKAAASIYGTWLVSDDPDSPHRAAARAGAELYFACAEEDHWAPLDVVATLDRTLKTIGANAEVEIYRGVEHGFAFPSRHSYDRVATDRHWERLIALFRRNLE